MSDRSILRRLLITVVVVVILAHAGVAQTETTEPMLVPLANDLIARLPKEIGNKARTLLKFTEEYQKRQRAMPEEEFRADIVGRLTRLEPAMRLVLKLLPKESSARVRFAIIRNLHLWPHWREYPETINILARLIKTDPDAGVSLRALEVLRLIRMGEGRALLDARIATEKEKTDTTETLNRFAQEQERWISLGKGTMLPSFLRVPPPRFDAPSDRARARILAFGDFGYGTDAQKRLAAEMLKVHRSVPFDFGITTGDNFYPRGMEGTADPRWDTYWEKLYATLGIKFYPTFGNHDWAHPDSPAAEILYSSKSASWTMPAPYYTFTAGPVQFFAMDTNEISEAQLIWLDAELKKSTAPWKVVYGHHPVYSASEHGDTPEMVKLVLPLLKEHKVDLYVAGHEHNLQLLKPESGVHFVISGGGGMGTYSVNQKDPRLEFGRAVNGFAVIDAQPQALTISYFGLAGENLYSQTIRK